MAELQSVDTKLYHAAFDGMWEVIRAKTEAEARTILTQHHGVLDGVEMSEYNCTEPQADHQRGRKVLLNRLVFSGKYRSKARTVNAWPVPQMDALAVSNPDLQTLLIDMDWDYDDAGIVIPTNHGPVLAKPGDVIVYSGDDYYPMTGNEFEKKYELDT